MGQSETKIVDLDGETSPSHSETENRSCKDDDASSSTSCLSTPTARLPKSLDDNVGTVSEASDSVSVTELERGKAKSLKMIVKKDLDYLIGNLEKLPESARKLFDVAKLYLTTESSSSNNEKDFTSLFQALPEPTAAKDVSSGAQKEVTETTSLKYPDKLFVPLKKSAPLHYAQTYIQWKSAQDLKNVYAFCLPKRRTIYLQPIDEFPDFLTKFSLQTHHLKLNLFETLQGFAQIFFSGLEVLIRPPVLVEENGWRVRSRYHASTDEMQYCVNDLYPLLQGILPGDGVCIAGIIWTDIYPEGYNFVLGEASSRHQAAVISFGRFEPIGFDKSNHSDVTEVDGTLIWKLLKSLSHELCHLFGLEHCSFFRCAMNESSSVSDALSHPLFLCPVCLRKLQRACGFDVLERYQQLRAFLSSVIGQLESTSKLEESLAWLDMCIEYLNS